MPEIEVEIVDSGDHISGVLAVNGNTAAGQFTQKNACLYH